MDRLRLLCEALGAQPARRVKPEALRASVRFGLLLGPAGRCEFRSTNRRGARRTGANAAG
jgi:hypothetical protein